MKGGRRHGGQKEGEECYVDRKSIDHLLLDAGRKGGFNESYAGWCHGMDRDTS